MLNEKNMIETIPKILDSLAKYSWGILVVCIFILFLPDDIARKIGIIEIRTSYQGYWWILFVFSGAIWLGAIYSKCSNLIANMYAKSKTNRENFAKLEKKKQIIINRLYSLNDAERKWLAYCLINSVQTLYAVQTNSTANSLLNKGIVQGGSGSIMSLPFTLTDFIWEYVLLHREDFLPPEVENNPTAIRELERFNERLTSIY